MPLIPEIERLIAEAGSQEDVGRRRQAEVLYLDAIKKLAAGDEELGGMISINLGSNAVEDGRLNDAVRYYTQAIRLLDGLKGEAMLQCAHAHYNLARAHLRSAAPDALVHAEKALALYERYPFSLPVDVADARTLRVVARVTVGEAIDERAVFDTWEAVKSVPYAALDTTLAVQFLEIFVPVVHHTHPASYHARIADIAAWASPALAAQLSALVERRPP